MTETMISKPEQLVTTQSQAIETTQQEELKLGTAASGLMEATQRITDSDVTTSQNQPQLQVEQSKTESA